MKSALRRWLPGPRWLALGASVTLYLNPAQAYVFDAPGNLLVAPQET